jgi:hypothetical protein
MVARPADVWTVHVMTTRERIGTDLFMAAEDDKATATRLTALGGTQSPESDRAASVLSEPAFELTLGGVVWQAAEMKDLGTLAEEGANVTAGVERTRKNIRVATGVGLRWSRLLAKRTEAASQSESFLECTARRRGREGLKVEGQATSDLAGRAYFLDLETCADRRQAGGAESQGFRMVRLESLILSTKTEKDRVLHVGRQNDTLVTSLTRHLDTEIPRSQGNESELGSGTRSSVLVHEVLAGIRIEGGDGIAVAAGLLNMLPGESGKGRAQWGDWSVCRADQHRLVM